MPIIDQGQLGQITGQGLAGNCLSTQVYGNWQYFDPYAELRILVAKMQAAMEPKDEKVKRLEAQVAELTEKLAAVKKAAG